MRDYVQSARFDRQLRERLVIRICQYRLPPGSERPFLCPYADSI
jgi:hypothetical protein